MQLEKKDMICAVQLSGYCRKSLLFPYVVSRVRREHIHLSIFFVLKMYYARVHSRRLYSLLAF